MVRLIDADAMIKRLCEDCNPDRKENCTKECATIEWINEEPTITRSQLRRMVLSDEEPVKHAHKVDVSVESGIERWMRSDSK